MAESASLGVLLDHTQDKIVLLDEGGRFTYANEAIERTLGYDRDEIMGQNAFEYVHPDDVEEAKAAFRKTIESDAFTETTVEYRIRAADGSWVWLESRMSNLTDDELGGYVVSSRDVTDRVEAERERLETATRLREIAATTGDVLWLFDGDWSEVLFVNPAYEAVYGTSVEELKENPRNFLDAIHPEDVPVVRDAMECLTAGEPVDMEYRVNPSADYDTWVWVQGQPVIEDGEVVRITGFARDVSDRRRRERQLYVMDNLLRHNVRNEVNVVLGEAELIEEEAPDVSDRTAVIRRTGEDLLASAEKEREIIDLLTGEARGQRLDVAEVIAGAVETTRERFPEATITADTPDGVAVYALDELRSALVELLENAIRHGEGSTPWVRVGARREGESVTVTVEDDAPPIPPVEANVLTGDHEMDSIYHSSGLGLWLVYWVVDLSDGKIDVARTDSGNRVSVSVPLART
jgi:PAS domain S-box-containing protein